MVNIHGLVRGSAIEFGRDADTGGQTRYLIDLVRNLVSDDRIQRIDIATRLIRDKRVSETYSEPEEAVNSKARIVRLACGGYKYLSKERLWPVLDEYTDRLIEYIRSQERLPDFVHGHYADSGYVASQIARTFGIPMLFTAHSLGRNKLAFLLDSGMDFEAANRTYAMSTRIDIEEEILAAADLVIASTRFEKEELYGQYEHRAIPAYAVIPPGLELENFFPYYHYEIPGSDIPEKAKQAHVRIQNELRRFHFEPDKPLILSLCRPDARKNIDLLIDVYGRDRELQAIANLAIFAGIRENISDMGDGERQVLTDILLAMDKYDLYGKMAIPKFHDPERDVPELYRSAALKRGVFVSASYLETFGLTFIEASASGLPFVATDRGGPVDIVENCRSGLLADIGSREAIARQLKAVLTDAALWNRLSEEGINRTRTVYTWKNHCQRYIEELEKLRGNKHSVKVEEESKSIGERFHAIDRLLIADIDDTLLGDDEAAQRLRLFLEERNEHFGFGAATGRDRDSALQVLKEHGFERVDIIISSVGTEIYYSGRMEYDRGWASRIRKNWKPELVRKALSSLDFLTLQENPAAQREFKISWYLDSAVHPDEALPLIHNEMAKQRLSYNLIFSHGAFLDILPFRASKGHAIRYLSRKWNIPMSRILTAGNSGNDRDMLYGRMLGTVVANHEPELDSLHRSSQIYYSPESYAAGVLDGILYWERQLDKEG